MLGRIRRRLVALARAAHRVNLAELLDHPPAGREQHAKTEGHAIDALRTARPPAPQIADDIVQWSAPRAVRVLHAHGITTLADLTVRIPRRRQWWKPVPGLGVASARAIEAFFAAWPALTEKARALVVTDRRGPMDAMCVPWEAIRVPHEVDGSAGTFRAPPATCTLDATNDYQVVQTWFALHESPATQRTAYRKEAEHLILWAIVERGRARPSLTTEDAIAYRAFLRQPSPRARWVGPVRDRTSPDWRPFNGSLSARSVAHALSILGALFRWLVEQRYVLTNPFAGVKVRGSSATALDASRAFTDGEWALVCTMVDRLEWSYGRSAPAERTGAVNTGYGSRVKVKSSHAAAARAGCAGALPGRTRIIRRGPCAGIRRPPSSAAWRPTAARPSAARACGSYAAFFLHWRRSRSRLIMRRSRTSSARQSALDAPYTRHPRARQRRGTDRRTRQPPSCVRLHHLDLSAQR